MNKNYRRNEIETKLRNGDYRPLDVMVAGCTGAGKSTTLNSLFEKNVAGVGHGADPFTMSVSSYRFTDNIRLWDTPGLGDGVEIDRRHEKKLIDCLWKTYVMDDRRYGLVDLALIIVDGSVRDLGTAYHLIKDIIVPNIQRNRILVAINQADMAMKGRHFNYDTCKPDAELKNYLEEQALSVQKRIHEATGVKIIKPVYYSAEYNYNIDKFYDMIVDHIPKERRSLNF
ncbi:MAG: GTPase family protein [Oscillospiraceae bacterium]